jgi:hypothetical protein
MNVAAGLCFVVFVGLGLAAIRSERRAGRGRRSFVNAFLIYALAASFGAGLAQRDAWPFSAWPLVAGRLPPTVTHPRLVAVDGAGREHDVDYRAWQPLGVDELLSWLDAGFPKLSAEAQQRAFGFLLGRAEQARRQARAGEPVGECDRLLGPLAAPYFLLHPKLWSDPARVPESPFVGVRFYRETWNLEQRRRDAARVTRILVHELAPP